MLQNLSVQFSSITRGAFFFIRLQTETCSVVLGIFRECGTVFYRVRYGAVQCIHLVIPILACPSWAQTHSSEMTIDSER